MRQLGNRLSRRGRVRVLGSAVAQARSRIVATNQRTADLSRTVTATNDRLQQRTFHLLGGKVSSLSIGVSPRYMIVNGEAAVSVAFTVDAVALEIEGVGTYPVTFAGSRSLTVNPTDVLVWSDNIAIPAPVLAALGKNSRVWLRAQATATNLRLPMNTCYMIGTSSSWTGNGSYLYPSATAQDASVVSQIDGQGALIVPAGNQTSGVNNNMRTGQSSNTGHVLPFFIRGTYTGTEKSVFVVGDSNSAGVGDPDVSPAYASNGSVGGRGLFGRASINLDADIQATAMCNSGLSAALASGWSSAGGSLLRSELLKFSDIVVEAMGNNDHSTSTPAVDVVARRREMWAAAKAAGCKVIALTVPPRTTSASNLTPVGNFVAGGEVDQHNAMLPAEVAAGRIDRVLNVRTYCAEPANQNVWLSPASSYVRTDGTHFKSGSTVAIAAALTTMMEGM